MAIKRVVSKLHVAPNPNSKVANDKIDVVIEKNLDIFRINWSL